MAGQRSRWTRPPASPLAALAPALFAQRGQRRDLPDELQPQCRGRSWPMPENPANRESGIAPAIARPPLGATSESCSPWMTSAGTVMRRSAAVRLGWLALAASCRRKPAGSYPRS
jgi:hypothetical protein